MNADSDRATEIDHYHLHDPRDEATYILHSPAEMIATAQRLGSSRFQAVTRDGRYVQVSNNNGEWIREDGVDVLLGGPARLPPRRPTPVEVAARADIESSYYDALAVPEDALGADDARELVAQNLACLGRIRELEERRVAMASIAWIARRQVAYRTALGNQCPELAKEVLVLGFAPSV